MQRLPLLLVLLASLPGGCNDLDTFRTGPETVFRGPIAGSEISADGGDPNTSFIRSGFASYTQMELRFDPDRVATEPRAITTFDTLAGQPGRFRRTALQPIEPLTHDPLTKYDFPGGGRLINYIFGARIADEPRSALVFVSLMDDGDIEVRVIAPNAVTGDGETLEDLFGVFRLKRVNSP